MKKILLAIIILAQFSGSAQTVNEKVIAFVNTNMGKKVGTGQCWDLASAALNYAGAKWTSPWEFGTKVNYASQTVTPGDIIHFKKVKYKHGNFIGEYPEHTAIIYKVLKKGEWQIAEQNNNARLFVIVSDFYLAWKTKGTIEIFHPK